MESARDCWDEAWVVVVVVDQQAEQLQELVVALPVEVRLQGHLVPAP